MKDLGDKIIAGTVITFLLVFIFAIAEIILIGIPLWQEQYIAKENFCLEQGYPEYEEGFCIKEAGADFERREIHCSTKRAQTLHYNEVIERCRWIE